VSALASEKLDHRWFEDNEDPVILGVGRLNEQKDFQTLLRAFANVLKKRHAYLVILGEGEERSSLEVLSEELNVAHRVHMPGFVRNPYKYMARSDVFVLSSKFEGFGNVIVEAMACGCPVVSTNCRSGPTEILENGKWGRLVPVEDPLRMSNAINESIASPLPPSKERAQDFTAEVIMDQYCSLIYNLLSEKNG
jgi:glycosyltransferase involved in cell wall biosynthesis